MKPKKADVRPTRRGSSNPFLQRTERFFLRSTGSQAPAEQSVIVILLKLREKAGLGTMPGKERVYALH